MHFCCLFGHWIGWWKWMKSGWHVFAARQLLTPTIGDLARSKSSFRQLDSSHSLLSLPSDPGLKSLNCFNTIGQISKHTCASLGYNSSTWWPMLPKAISRLLRQPSPCPTQIFAPCSCSCLPPVQHLPAKNLSKLLWIIGHIYIYIEAPYHSSLGERELAQLHQCCSPEAPFEPLLPQAVAAWAKGRRIPESQRTFEKCPSMGLASDNYLSKSTWYSLISIKIFKTTSIFAEW